MSLDRFMCYIKGGQPEGSASKHAGMSEGNRAPPAGDAIFEIRHEMYFAKYATQWRGGVCFISPEAEDHRKTYCRIYQITRKQFIELIASENASDVNRISEEIGTFDFNKSDSLTVDGGWYNHVVRVGTHKDCPVWTFTQRNDERDNRNPPSREYLTTVVKGLAEAHITLDSSRSGRIKHFSQYLEHAVGADASVDNKRDPPKIVWTSERIRKLFEEYVFTVFRTKDCGGSRRSFIVQLSVTKPQSLENGNDVIVTSRHKNGHVARIRARVGRPQDEVPQGTIRMDQKLRQAIGVRAKVESSSDPNETDEVNTVTVSAAPTLVDKRPWWRKAFGPVARLGGSQPQIMRVVHSRYEDMEIRLCRFPQSGFDVLGCECGDTVTIVSPHARVHMRAIAATEKMEEIRQENENVSGTILISAKKKLTLERLEVPDEDIPAIYLDWAAREELGVKPCDAVTVERSVFSLLVKHAHFFAMTVLLSASMIVFDFTKDLGYWAHVSWFSGLTILAIAMMFLGMRQRL